LENRIPSARQLVYADARANPNGRLPDDTWVLRPQDLSDCFTTAEDTWYFPRVAGTFKERAGFHGCQMPEQLLGRIIRVCSNKSDVVLDPFSGSATTLAVAKKLGRQYLGFDLSHDYVNRGKNRLDDIRSGDPLDGADEPTISAPATAEGKRRTTGGKVVKGDLKKHTHEKNEGSRPATPLADKAFRCGLVEAFRRVYDGYSLDRVVADPDLNQRFADACQNLGLQTEIRTWNWTLFRMRKAGLLADLPTTRRTELSWDDCENYLFASEIAWRQMVDSGCDSLDFIFCDPVLAAKFDEIARRWAPGYSSLQYRWAAMKLRKSSKQVRCRAELLDRAKRRTTKARKSVATEDERVLGVRFTQELSLDGSGASCLPEESGIYVVSSASDNKPLYAGESINLRHRIQSQFGPDTRATWQELSKVLTARYFPTTCPSTDRRAYQHLLVKYHNPALNLPDQKMV
jgi:site-specific DNA-methyltransferase (adenine-specific)